MTREYERGEEIAERQRDILEAAMNIHGVRWRGEKRRRRASKHEKSFASAVCRPNPSRRSTVHQPPAHAVQQPRRPVARLHLIRAQSEARRTSLKAYMKRAL